MHRNYNNYLNIIISGFKCNFGVSTELAIPSDISQNISVIEIAKWQIEKINKWTNLK
jgi:hypothetical protein